MTKNSSGDESNFSEFVSIENFPRYVLENGVLKDKVNLSLAICENNFSSRVQYAVRFKDQKELDSLVDFLKKETGCVIGKSNKNLLIKISEFKVPFNLLKKKYLDPLFEAFENHLDIPKSCHKFTVTVDSDGRNFKEIVDSFHKQIVKVYLISTSLKNTLTFSLIRRCQFLKNLSICERLSHQEQKELFDVIQNLPFIDDLYFECVKEMESFSIENLQRLRTLFVRSCNFVDKIKIKNCPHLEVIEIHSCKKLSKLSIGEVSCLEYFRVVSCQSLFHILFKDVHSLKFLSLVDLKSYKNLSQISKIPNLEEFYFSGQSKICDLTLKDFQFLKKIIIDKSSVKRLNIRNLKNLKTLTVVGSRMKTLSVKNAIHLEFLNINLCEKLHKITLFDTPKISDLCLSICAKLREITGLMSLTQLTRLEVYKCSSLRKISTKGMMSLEEIRIETCSRLQSLDFFSCNPLKSIRIYLCRSLEKIKGIDKLSNLQNMNINKCKSLHSIRIGGGNEDKVAQVQVEIKSSKS